VLSDDRLDAAARGLMDHWPYQKWVAHRGAGKLAPENTLAAFRLGASHGYRMFECDVKLSRDDVPFLLHDDTLNRTTDGLGMAGEKTWQDLQKLDAGSWHSPRYKAEPLPSLSTIAGYCIANGFDLNIEIKPTGGTDQHTGTVVAQHASRLWQNESRKPLLTSFNPEALQAAADAAPELPRGLLLHELWTGWLETALMLDCVAIICHHRLWDTSSVTQAKSAGFKILAYTANDKADVQRLQCLGADGIITDQVDLFQT
jgi:glycerophosphoryl diester phosphodiesterase